MNSRLSRSFIEPLEARIAPALLVNGANLLGGAGNPTTGETSVGDNAVTLVKVLSGQALVWFNDGEIFTISFGPNTSLEITGNIIGDVVGNLTAAGTLSDSDDNAANGEDGGRLLANNLIGLKTKPLSDQKGSLKNIITGGAISGLSINGELQGAYAGDGAFRAESEVLTGVLVTSLVGKLEVPDPFQPEVLLDINPVVPGTQSTFDFAENKAFFQAGATIKNAKIALAPGLQMIAGNGSRAGAAIALSGPAGGGISGITIDSALVPTDAPTDTPSYWLIAGDGADGSKSGGAGGSIDRIIEKNSFGPVKIEAGQGGNGGAGVGAIGGAGGAGGSVSYLDLQSNSAHYMVKAGHGGDGAPAGNGGRLLNNNFSNRTPVSGIIVAADFTGDGKDDILVVDAATGQMIIDTEDDFDPTNGQPEQLDGAFHQLVQFENPSQDKVVLIDSAGLSPVDAVATDVNADGLLDIVVAYKNSSDIAVYLNQGGGSFYDPSTSAYATAGIGLGFAPVKIATNGPGGGILTIAENREGKGVMHYGIFGGSTADDLEFELAAGSNEFGQPITDVVYGDGQFITAFANGAMFKLQPAGINETKAFIVTDTKFTIPGGITDLEVDSTGTRLLALSPIAHTVTVFDLTAESFTPALSTIMLSAATKPLVAHFTHDTDLTTADDIAVLSLLPGTSRITSYTQVVDADPLTVDPFNVTGTLNTATALKNFVPIYDQGDFNGNAALAGSMNSFLITPDLISTTSYALPFASKIIEINAGNGGDGVNFAKAIGKGGAGGGIIGLNADANEIRLFAGQGGDSQGGAAGAGGSVQNPATFTTAAGAVVAPTLIADVVLEIGAGGGGTPSGVAMKTATGGAGGSLGGLSIILDSGDITLTTGNGGDGNGGVAGAGGSITGTKTVAHDGNLTLSTGAGGEALSGLVAGGAGGSIITFHHELALEPEAELLEKPYSVAITTGIGGTSAQGIGGAGGSVQGVTLKLDGADRTYDDPSVDPPLVDAQKDSTVRVSVVTGAGGEGANGGAGGSIKDFSSTSVFDQELSSGTFRNYVVMQLTAGAGGEGTAGNGGAGGGILLSRPISGVTFYDFDAVALNDPRDPDNYLPFIATAGAGGQGTLRGGAGGAVTGLTLQNSASANGNFLSGTQLVSAVVKAGAGGAGLSLDGGAGGVVSGATIGTQGGYLDIFAGKGGAGGALGKGGAGGAISGSTFGVVNTFASLGLSVLAGAGGNGTLGGGVGGALANLQISTPQSTDGISAILRSGDGGSANASGKAIGGKGGDISGITQGKDVNSSINLIQAGNGGGNALGTAGAGGNISAIKTVGFIGRPSDADFRLGVFDVLDPQGAAIEIPQGLFSGRGGQGLFDGINGSVTNVTARQIAAIAAAVDANGLFAAASKISMVKASLIGFDLNQSGTFNSSVGSASPGTVKAVDGFIFGTVIDKVFGATGVTFVNPV